MTRTPWLPTLLALGSGERQHPRAQAHTHTWRLGDARECSQATTDKRTQQTPGENRGGTPDLVQAIDNAPSTAVGVARMLDSTAHQRLPVGNNPHQA